LLYYLNCVYWSLLPTVLELQLDKITILYLSLTLVNFVFIQIAYLYVKHDKRNIIILLRTTLSQIMIELKLHKIKQSLRIYVPTRLPRRLLASL
jgi:hypothetical protein